MRNAITDYYQGLINGKVLDNNQHSVKLSSVEVGGRYLTREKDILEALNQHYISVGPNLADKIISKPGDDIS